MIQKTCWYKERGGKREEACDRMGGEGGAQRCEGRTGEERGEESEDSLPPLDGIEESLEALYI